MRPNAETKVDIHMVNETNVSMTFQTEWSYPAVPFWILAHGRCIDARENWNSYIDYSQPDPAAMVTAYVRKYGCSGKSGSGLLHKFKDIHLKNGRGLIQVRVRRKEPHLFEFCSKQGDETDYRCDDFVSFG